MLECAIHPITYRGEGILATVVKMLQCLHNCTLFIFWTLRLPAIFIFR